MDSPPAYEETPLVSKGELQNEATDYIPGPPPDYLAALDMDEYGPPRYEDPPVEGFEIIQDKVPDQQTTAEKLQLPRLAYVDFLPYCFQRGDKHTKKKPVFDTFRGLFRHANAWLSVNSMYKVVDIESIERMVGFDGLVDSGSAIEHTASCGMNGVLRGVRLWLIPNPDHSSPPQVISYFNWLPEEDPIERDLFVRHGYGRGVYMKHTVLFPNFKPMSETLRKLNECISNQPIPGTVLTVQTLELLYQQAWGKKCLDPDLSSYFSIGDKPKLYLNYLRIFYLAGPPCAQKIGLKDFAPVVTYKARSAIAKPRFEEYNDVFQKAGHWIYQNDTKAIRFTNLQSIQFKSDGNTLSRCSVDDVIVDSDSTWYNDTNSYSHFVKVIRAAYVELEEPEDRTSVPLTTRLFIPVRTGIKTAESIPQTLQRINAWLNVTGAPVCSVGTEKFLFTQDSLEKPVKPDQMAMSVLGNRGVYMITGIRLYLFGFYQEPDPMLLPPVHPYITNGGSSCCTIS